MRTQIAHRFLTALLASAVVFASACGGDDATAPTPSDPTDVGGEPIDDTADDPSADTTPEPVDDDAGPADDVSDMPAEDSCTEEESSTLLNMDLGQIMGTCAGECMTEGATDVEGCGASCVAGLTGVSDTCSDCFGVFLDCTMVECSMPSEDPSAPAPPCPAGDEACDQCVRDKCEPALMVCIGVPGGPEQPQPGDDNGCMGQADQDAIATGAEAMLTDCATPCLDQDDRGQCLEACAKDIGVSDSCGECFYHYGDCVGTNCGEFCTPETVDSVGCQECMVMHCAGGFAECSGVDLFSGNGDPSAPACNSPADMAIMESDEDLTGPCVDQCIPGDDPQGCMADCLAEAGYSMGCADCLGDFSTCVATSCADDCFGDAGSEACDICMGEQCYQQAVDCFGPPDGGQTGGDPMCGAQPDQEALTANPELPQECAIQCGADSDPGACITACLADAGLTQGCSDCVSWMQGCIFESCAVECTDPMQAEACGACIDNSCGEEVVACFGSDGSPGGGQTGGGGGADESVCSQEDSAILINNKPDEVCGMQCFAAPDKNQCITDCMMAEGLSEDCSGCMANMLICVFDSCMMECMDGGSDCEACVDTNCGEQSQACFGGGDGGGAHP